jgi:hypothetical protein
LAFLALALGVVPLFNLLGYDFSFAMGLLAAIAAADLGHGVARAAQKHASPHGTFALAGRSALVACAVLFLPLVFSLLNAVWVKNCNLGAGLVFFLLLPLSTALLASSVGTVTAVLFPQKRCGRILAFAIPVGSILWSLVRLYFDPAVFALDPFGGYFPGPIYDEALRPPLTLFLYRLLNFIWALTWLAVTALFTNSLHGPPQAPSFANLRQPLRFLILGVFLVTLSSLGFIFRGQLGFHITHQDLVRVLPRQLSTQHFVVWVDPKAERETDLALFLRDLEFRYHQLKTTLEVEPKLPITVYRFPTAEEKKQAVGAGGTLYAKPWTREIFIHADRFPSRNLRHELAHVFASAFGDPIFGVALAWKGLLPRLASGLIEGLAMAVDADDPHGAFTLHEEACAMQELGQLPSLGKAMGIGFTLESGARAYTVVGSFCHYLLKRFGGPALRKIYQTAGDFQAVTGQDLHSLIAEYLTFLATQPRNPQAIALAEERFRRPAIFGKVCARELAARVAEAHDYLASYPDQAVRLLERTCMDDPNEPSYRLDLAFAQVAQGNPTAAVATLDSVFERLSLPLKHRAQGLLASIAFRGGDWTRAKQNVQKIFAKATDLTEERSAKARLRALEGDAAGTILGRALFGDPKPMDPALVVFLITEFARLAPNEALGPYLVGRQLVDRDPALAKVQFLTACPLEGAEHATPLSDVFLRECRRLLGETAFLTNDWPLAEAAFSSILKLSPHLAESLRTQTFLTRIAWERQHQGTVAHPSSGKVGEDTAK